VVSHQCFVYGWDSISDRWGQRSLGWWSYRFQMKPTFIILSLFLSIAVAPAAPAHIQSGYGEAFPETVGTVTFGVPGVSGEDVTAGSLLVLSYRSDNNTGNTVSSVTSSPGSPTWTKAAAQLSVTDFWLEVWYCTNAPAGSTTVTVTVGSPADQMRMTLDEYSGVAVAAPVDDTSTATDTGATANPGNVTTSATDVLIHVAVASDGNDEADTFTAGSGYTIHNLGPDPSGSDKTMTQHRVAATAGTYGTTMGNINDSWSGVAVAFLPAGGGGGPVTPLPRIQLKGPTTTGGKVGFSMLLNPGSQPFLVQRSSDMLLWEDALRGADGFQSIDAIIDVTSPRRFYRMLP
jgi:hypothetical protein